jgi:ectoine hydroxylase-related dioxygenase (phytanoyl-CoA dioxygenase family)
MSSNANAINTNADCYGPAGYCFFSEVLSATEIAEVRQELDRLVEDMPATQTVVKDGVDTEVAARPEYLTEPHVKSDFWLSLCRHPRILDKVEAVLGPDLVLLMSHIICKPAGDGLPVAWHQDNTYWPSVDGTDVGTVWMAIDDVDEANGCMKVIPNTHAGYTDMEKHQTDGGDLLGLEVAVSPVMAEGAVALEMGAGSLSIHDSFIIHGSEANHSSRRRAAYTMRYANAKTVKVDTTKHWVPVYLMRGESDGDYIDRR